MQQQKQAIANAVATYIAETRTPEAIAKNDRAASPQRVQEMQQILKVLEDPEIKTVAQLQEKMKPVLANIKTSWRGKSRLKELVEKSLTPVTSVVTELGLFKTISSPKAEPEEKFTPTAIKRKIPASTSETVPNENKNTGNNIELDTSFKR